MDDMRTSWMSVVALLLATTHCTPAEAEAEVFCRRLESCGLHEPDCRADVETLLPEQPALCQMCLMSRTCEGHRVGLEKTDRGICDYVCD
jgi:hypothetical protein